MKAVVCLLVGVLAASAAATAQSQGPRPGPTDGDAQWISELERAVAAGVPTEALVLFDDADVEREARTSRERRKLQFDDADVLAHKAARLHRLKHQAMTAMDASAYSLVQDYSHLPFALVRFSNRRALDQLRARREFRALFANGRKELMLDAVSASLVRQPPAQALGLTGTGTTVLVVDSGVDYAQPDFGTCTSPGVPASTCRLVYASNIAGSGGDKDTSTAQHGTNVAGIAAGVAPGTKIASINVFGTASGTTDSLILQAINWGIAQQATYNIRAINLSLGDGSSNTAPCANPSLNPYVTAVNNAGSAGILVVAAAGNEGYTSAIANPACTPKVLSVGAVYSQNWGAVSGSCSDPTTAADQVACFSNSASFLTAWAPGAFITAGGRQLGGTSQAAPFIAGAAAVLRAAYPGDTLDQTVSRITTYGVPVTDARNGVVKPRLDLFESARPGNDDFVNRFTASGSIGSTTANNQHATKEALEPNHAGNAGGRSLWWRWTAPASGQVALDTHGASIDTLLAVYTGASVANLVAVASNDNDGFANGASGLYFQAQSGAEYEFAVDGKDGASGALTVEWQLNTSALANLRTSTVITPSRPAVGELVTLSVTVVNDGPQPATGVTVTGTIPPQFSYISADAACVIAGGGTSFTCSVGTVLTAAAGTVNLVLRATATGTVQFSASASSEVADPVLSNNSSSTQTSVASSRSVPLPSWALLVTAGLLAGIAIGTARRSA